MRAEEDVDGQGLEDRERLDVVLGDLRVVLVADQDVAGVHVRAADDDGVQRASAVRHLQRPGGAALRVAGRQVRHEPRAAEFDRVAVVQRPVHVRARPAGRRALLLRDVALHHHQLRAGLLLNDARRLVVIAVGVADQDDLGVGVLEAELRDGLLDRRHILLEVGVDQDVALRRIDQVDGQIGRADVVKVAGDLEPRDFAVPVGVALRQQGRCVQGERGQQRDDCEMNSHRHLVTCSLHPTGVTGGLSRC